jgi:hypothetical protein
MHIYVDNISQPQNQNLTGIIETLVEGQIPRPKTVVPHRSLLHQNLKRITQRV